MSYWQAGIARSPSNPHQRPRSKRGAVSDDQAWRGYVDVVVARARKYYGASLNNRITKAHHYILNDQLEIDG